MKVRKILSILKMIINSFKNPSLLTRKSMKMIGIVKSRAKMSQRANKKKKMTRRMCRLMRVKVRTMTLRSPNSKLPRLTEFQSILISSQVTLM
jgi:hypothetical protein